MLPDTSIDVGLDLNFGIGNYQLGVTGIGHGNGTVIEVDDPSQGIKFKGSEYQRSTVVVDSSITTSYTVLDSDRIIYVNTNTAGVTVTLPSVTTYDKRIVRIKCTGSNNVTVAASVGSVDTNSIGMGQVGEWQAINSAITWYRIM